MSNLIVINFEGVHSFLFPMKTKTQPLSQHKTFFNSHSEAKTTLKYLGWLSAAVLSIVQCPLNCDNVTNHLQRLLPRLPHHDSVPSTAVSPQSVSQNSLSLCCWGFCHSSKRSS